MQDLKVSIIQTRLHWEDRDKNLSMFSKKIDAARLAADLIVLPEMFSTGFSMRSEELAEGMNGKTMSWMANKAIEKACVITGSLITKEDGKYFNRLVWMRPDGSFAHYDKRHLFRMMNEQLHYSAGDKRIVVTLNGWRICPLICYDLRFPVWCRNRGDYDMLIYIANWPEARREAWRALLPARAHENQCYVAGVNRVGEDGKGVVFSGDSAVFDPKGNLLCAIKPYKETVKTITLSYNDLVDFRNKFPVGLDADEFTIF